MSGNFLYQRSGGDGREKSGSDVIEVIANKTKGGMQAENCRFWNWNGWMGAVYGLAELPVLKNSRKPDNFP